MEKPVKAPNYTSELVDQIKADYDGGKGLSAKELAVKYNRSVRSIVGKLVSEKVYVKAEVPVKEHVDTGPTKKEYQKILEDLGFSADAVNGLGNATKNALAEVIEKVKTAQAA